MTTVDITYRGMDPSPAVNDWIERWAERLHRAFERIEHCAVVVEIPHRHQQRGRTFQVHLHITVARRTIAITRDHGHESAYVAVADAFRAARRELLDLARIRRDVKLHALGG